MKTGLLLGMVFPAVITFVVQQHALAETNVVGWGSNAQGQLNVPADLTNAIAVAAGTAHSLALRADGTVAAWGDNSAGQTNIPSGLSNVIAIASGSAHNLALKSDGTVVGWGANSSGQTNPPAGLSNVVGVAASGSTSFGLKSDGSVVVWGTAPSPPVGLGNVITIGPGSPPVAITVKGTVLSWGSTPGFSSGPTNFIYELGGSGPVLTIDGRVRTISGGRVFDAGLSNIVAIASSPTAPRYLALSADGVVYNGPTNLANVVAIASGPNHSLAVIGKGPPMFTSRPMNLSINPGSTARFYAPASGAWPIKYQWRFNGTDIPGAAGPILVVTNVQLENFGTYQVVASNSVGLAIGPPTGLSLLPIVGQDWCPNLTNVVAIAAWGPDQGLALTPEGQVVAWGANDVGQSTVPPGLSNVVAISAYSPALVGRGHSLALTASGTVYSWGRNSFTNASSKLTNLVAISAGSANDMGLRADGTVAFWLTSSTITLPPQPYTNVTAIASGKSASWSGVVVKADGALIAAPAVSNAVAVACNGSDGLALLADGSLASWALTQGAPTNVPAGLSNVVAIAAGDQVGPYNLALKAEGTLVAWGAVPAFVSNMVATVTNAVMIDGGLALIGNGPPFLTTLLVNRFGVTGGNVFFRGLATGARPLSYQWQHNGADLAGQTETVLCLSNLSVAGAGAYTLLVTNAYGAITSPPAMLAIYDYAPALNNSDISWTSFGDAVWFAETNTTHDGTSAAQSGVFSYSAPGLKSTLRGTIAGPGTLSFWLKMSGTLGGQSLSFYVNGSSNSVFSIKAPTDWQQRTVYLGSGQQIFDWVFTSGIGQSVGWLDEVTFTPGTTTPFITAQPASQAQAPGGDVQFTVLASGTPPLGYQWSFNGIDLSGATNATLAAANVGPGSAGSYSVLVTNIAGSALSSDADLVLGRVAAWGYYPGYYPIPPTVTNASMLAAGSYHALALQPDGTVLAWGNYVAGQTAVPSNATNLTSIGAGDWFSMGVRSDATVTEWGDNSYGQSTVPSGLTNVLMVAGGSYHALALKADGTVMAWGRNDHGQTNVPADLTNVVQIAAAGNLNVALRSDGTVIAWGDNSYGATNVPVGLNDLVAVRAGFNYCLALKSGGSVISWGSTNYGEGNIPPTLTNALGIAAGGQYGLALTPDGKITSWGTGQNGAAQVPSGLVNVRSIVAGGYMSLALVSDTLPSSSVPVRNPNISGEHFQVSIPTQSGCVYRLEYKDSLSDPAWLSSPLVAGNGREQVLVDSRAMGPQRFYRVRGW